MTKRKNDELTLLQAPAEKFLDKLGIKYLHIQKTVGRKFDSNSKLKGFPDLEVFIPGGSPVFFEFKVPGNTLKIKQHEWRDYLLKAGYNYRVIYDIEDFYFIIKNIKNKNIKCLECDRMAVIGACQNCEIKGAKNG